SCFFFQAEDGIRDRNVTWSSDVCSSDLDRGGQFAAQLVFDLGHARIIAPCRTERRRLGRSCTYEAVPMRMGWPLVAAAGIAGYAVGIERTAFTVRHVEVPTLPPGSSPVRVLHLSDAHMTPRQHRKQAWISSLAALDRK